ncbi:hypothetical protein OsI_17284 [Oryza sativa Indica Group]|uniref:Uncharacterized protein n=1 Tax=Oryza sativa subsp. indica TaxID=39946 RepID=B8ATT9_ORYSI|nr:hypothetical protein OsI_17284 [Oryza sativa Indica Group]
MHHVAGFSFKRSSPRECDDELDQTYHLLYRPRAIWGRRPRPNGGRRRPRPIQGLFRVSHPAVNPTAEPIGRQFLEQLDYPLPTITGSALLDETNLILHDFYKNISDIRSQIYNQQGLRLAKMNVVKEQALWEEAEELVCTSKKIFDSTNLDKKLLYPFPSWFNSRETRKKNYLDLTSWVSLLETYANERSASPEADDEAYDVGLLDDKTGDASADLDYEKSACSGETSDAAFDEESASPGDATKEADIDEPIAILGTPMVARSVEWRPIA